MWLLCLRVWEQHRPRGWRRPPLTQQPCCFSPSSQGRWGLEHVQPGASPQRPPVQSHTGGRVPCPGHSSARSKTTALASSPQPIGGGSGQSGGQEGPVHEPAVAIMVHRAHHLWDPSLGNRLVQVRAMRAPACGTCGLPPPSCPWAGASGPQGDGKVRAGLPSLNGGPQGLSFLQAASPDAPPPTPASEILKPSAGSSPIWRKAQVLKGSHTIGPRHPLVPVHLSPEATPACS